ncbi:MAG: hypothetical protein JXR73_22355 [Candidatus Omnitrophica bacterium]|nr:hypothetical protein [Candidatus Omnitrophota bacterium]
MSKNRSISIEQKIHSALNACLGKMADRLENTFNPREKESLALFRQFCSALKTRMQWIKDCAKTFQEITGIVKRANDAAPHAATSPGSAQARLEQLLNRENPGSPLRPEDLNNGLVMTT